MILVVAVQPALLRIVPQSRRSAAAAKPYPAYATIRVCIGAMHDIR